MTSSFETQTHLKDKLSQVKHLLNDANERLQEEASKYGIFTTKTSAAGSATTNLTKQNNGALQEDVPADLRRTISDINTIQSVLLCPVFNQIVNVTDSLSKLSHHLNLRPSIGPADINFDANGELILKPPIEPVSFNNLVNSKLGEYSENSNHSPQVNKDFVHNNSNGTKQNVYNEHQLQMRSQQMVLNSQFDSNGGEMRSNGYVQPQVVDNEQLKRNLLAQRFDNQSHHELGIISSYVPQSPPTTVSPHEGYDTEKLVTNGTQNHVNGNKLKSHEPTKVASVAAAFEPNDGLSEGRRLYKANGHFALNQMVPSDLDVKRDFEITRSMSQISEQLNDSQAFGYSNDMYKTTHELNRTEDMAIEHQFQATSNGKSHDAYINDIQGNSNNNSLSDNNSYGKSQASQSAVVRQNRASPSTSAGSTVRLADECDSGTSSFRSQAAKGTLYSPQPHKQKDITDEEPVDSSIDQELIEKLSPEMERIKVTLEKDNNGLGITIAGYTCEQEEISGIFIKSIAPGSPADRSGKIRILDQIFAVNGQEILGYSNPEAVNVLRRHTGRVVTLELMRYLAESKYRKLQTLLDHAAPSTGLQNTNNQISAHNTNYSNVLLSPNKSIIPVPEACNDGSGSPTKSFSPVSGKQNFYVQTRDTQPVESIYKNTSVFHKTETESSVDDVTFRNQTNGSNFATSAQNQMPVAAQRGATTNKIIETKQGARNTIDIRSPLCQATATATYVNKVTDMDFCDSAKRSMAARLKQEASDEFGQFVRSEEPEWEKDVQIVELCKDSSQGLGFTVKEYANPKDQKQSIIMVTSLTPGGIAERDGRLSFGDLLIFVDDTSLEGASLAETVRALKKTSGQVRLGVLKLKRN